MKQFEWDRDQRNYVRTTRIKSTRIYTELHHKEIPPELFIKATTYSGEYTFGPFSSHEEANKFLAPAPPKKKQRPNNVLYIQGVGEIKAQNIIRIVVVPKGKSFAVQIWQKGGKFNNAYIRQSIEEATRIVNKLYVWFNHNKKGE